MRLNCKFLEIEVLRLKMNATTVLWDSAMQPLPKLDEIDILLGSGLELDSLDQVTADERGLLTKDNRPVMLYIKASRNSRDTLLYHPEEAVRFHVADCQTLDRMRRDNRFEKYVLINDTSGIFKVDYSYWETGETGTVEARLFVCKNCLSFLNYKGYRFTTKFEQERIWRDFNIEHFFEEYHPNFSSLPSRTAGTAGASDYPKNWQEISNRIRALYNWKCDNCGVDLSAPENKKLLDVHHRNGVRSDNSNANLKPLCKLCHKKQPQHQFYYIHPMARLSILRLRQQQGITKT